MRAFGVCVVRAALGREVALVIDDEMILVEMIVFREIWTRVKLDPGGIRAKAVPHDEVTNAAKEISARDLRPCAVGGISWRYIRIVPEKLRYRDAPLWLRRPTTLTQKPRSIRIFETIDRITKTDVVFPLQIGKLVVVVTSRRAVRQDFVQ